MDQDHVKVFQSPYDAPEYPNIGDIWYNTTTEIFMVFDGIVWIPYTDEIFKADQAKQADPDSPEKAYERAMRVLK